MPETAPIVEVECHQGCALRERNVLADDEVTAAERGGPLLEVRRHPRSITLGIPDPVSPEALVHPLLTVPISILARWRGDLTLHAGCFVAGERAWGVIGAREAGKSTTLARLAERGHPLVADDLLVLDGDVVRAGPGCIDLRPDVAGRIEGSRSLGEVAGRERFRLSTPRAPDRTPLGGFFLLGWSEGEEPEIERVGAKQALEAIYAQEYMGLLGAADPSKIMNLLGSPVWQIRRPKDWAYTDRMIDGILEAAAAATG